MGRLKRGHNSERLITLTSDCILLFLDWIELTVILSMSLSHLPPSRSLMQAGPEMLNSSKSKRITQTSEKLRIKNIFLSFFKVIERWKRIVNLRSDFNWLVLKLTKCWSNKKNSFCRLLNAIIFFNFQVWFVVSFFLTLKLTS